MDLEISVALCSKVVSQVSKFATMIFLHIPLFQHQRVFSLAKNCVTWRIYLQSPMFPNLLAKNKRMSVQQGRNLYQCSKVVFFLFILFKCPIYLFIQLKNTIANKNRFSWKMSNHFWLAIYEYWNFLRKNQIRNTEK